MLPIQIYPDAGGILALGRTTLGRHVVIHLGRDYQKASVTLNQWELAALILALQSELASVQTQTQPPTKRTRTDATPTNH